MRKELYKSRYASHYYDEASQTMFSIWFNETQQMNADGFRVETEKWLEASLQCKPKNIFDYCVNFVYPISPEEQNWMAQLLNTAWVNMGVQKYAHIMPKELIANISSDQLFQEFTEMGLENQFTIGNFADTTEAINWLEVDAKALIDNEIPVG